jgi:hypothetical protein
LGRLLLSWDRRLESEIPFSFSKLSHIQPEREIEVVKGEMHSESLDEAQSWYTDASQRQRNDLAEQAISTV